MSLQSRAQQAAFPGLQPIQLIVEPSSFAPQQMGGPLSLIPLEQPLEVNEDDKDQDNRNVEEAIRALTGDEMGGGEEHSHHHEDKKDEDDLEVNEPGEVTIAVDDMNLGDVPGASNAAPLLEVNEVEAPAEVAPADDPKKSKKDSKWDWESRGATGFIAWIKERFDDVPQHTGMDTAGLERAVSYLEKLDNEISRAMRLDLDGELDANQIEKVRSMIDGGVTRLHDRLDKIKQHKKNSRKKKTTSSYAEDSIIKEAQKITGVQGVFVTVDLLTSLIARVCVNGMVSAGHDIEDLFERQAKYYNLNTREKAQVIQLLDDMGYAMRRDRGFMPDEDLHVEDSGNMDWAANYKG